MMYPAIPNVTYLTFIGDENPKLLCFFDDISLRDSEVKKFVSTVFCQHIVGYSIQLVASEVKSHYNSNSDRRQYKRYLIFAIVVFEEYYKHIIKSAASLVKKQKFLVIHQPRCLHNHRYAWFYA